MANPFRNIRVFFGETMGELKKATWPTFLELRDSTVVILIAVLLLGAFIALSDFSLYGWITLLTRLVRPDAS